jgi:hypothetical protein
MAYGEIFIDVGEGSYEGEGSYIGSIWRSAQDEIYVPDMSNEDSTNVIYDLGKVAGCLHRNEIIRDAIEGGSKQEAIKIFFSSFEEVRYRELADAFDKVMPKGGVVRLGHIGDSCG